MTQKLGMRTRRVLAASILVGGALLASQAAAIADAGDADPGHGMRRMHELMESGNPAMMQMHERMMDNPRASQAHERMMQQTDMGEMEDMMGGAMMMGDGGS